MLLNPGKEGCTEGATWGWVPKGEWSSSGGEYGGKHSWQWHGLEQWTRGAARRAVLGHGEKFSVVGIDFEKEVMRKSRVTSVKACLTLR